VYGCLPFSPTIRGVGDLLYILPCVGLGYVWLPLLQPNYKGCGGHTLSQIKRHVLNGYPLPAITGFLSLQPNGRKAVAAFSPTLAAALEQNALHEKRTLLHGEDGVCVVRGGGLVVKDKFFVVGCANF